MNSSLFFLGALGGEILPMEKGASSPFAEDLGNSVRLACAKGLQDPSPYSWILLPSLIALADGRVVLTKRPTLCVQPHLKSVSHPFAALMRSFPPHHRANTRCVGHFIKMTLPQNTNSSPRSLCELRGENSPYS